MGLARHSSSELEEYSRQRGGRRERSSHLAIVRVFVFLAVSLSILVAPLFAHGCHGDDIDHEPLLIPIRMNANDR